MDEYIKREDALKIIDSYSNLLPKEFLSRKEDEAYERGYAEGKADVARKILRRSKGTRKL